jgi:hypothetical protein
MKLDENCADYDGFADCARCGEMNCGNTCLRQRVFDFMRRCARYNFHILFCHFLGRGIIL